MKLDMVIVIKAIGLKSNNAKSITNIKYIFSYMFRLFSKRLPICVSLQIQLVTNSPLIVHPKGEKINENSHDNKMPRKIIAMPIK